MTNLGGLSIVKRTITKNELNIFQKMLHIKVLMLLQFFLDGSEIHGILNYVEVIVNT
jgi:hypothetical protein